MTLFIGQVFTSPPQNHAAAAPEGEPGLLWVQKHGKYTTKSPLFVYIFFTSA